MSKIVCLAAGSLIVCLAHAAQANDASTLFDTSYGEIISRRCLDCHGESKPKAGLNLGRRESVLEPITDGDEPVVIARQPDKSRLLGRVSDGSMPPEDEGPPLTAKEIAALKTWIEAGAPWPKGRVLKPATR
jgi:hypothetical protein